MKFVSETSYVGPLELVLDVLTSPELFRARTRAAGVAELADFADDGATHSFRLQVPTEQIPAAARSFFPHGAKVFATATPVVHNEAGRVDGAKIPYTIDVSGAPVAGSLTFLLADTGATTAAKISGEIKVSVPFIGGRIEKMVVDQLSKVIAKDTDLVNAEVLRRRTEEE
ncbi:hypothetical protein HMPREF3167_08080 [Trueperella sp. HMSC08B05]|uniref:Uncharacterized protein n=1 Tax=Trueperella bernardiae TaxID=59561 RepID=A0A0W1KK84_9ACTO|nr:MULTISPECIES: DUF2505 domain-containing protein [Trueperella]KTF04420.1 hypothetical protein AQZ59_00943 [Trueperella bernardiae]OCW60815.1 hypothetical protein AKG36_04000 [Trueperella bernardiae]OFS66759.1 hypothetical protein HMPREF3174_05600 [Trueperella sp. HMSC08H06]OFS72386.1 hypothetical protein HMPREF3167_08080 [Trueperella sp. HMSC08B05]PKZ89548.1 DUF2505 domain-containing protein [Trueperella bernardiae]